MMIRSGRSERSIPALMYTSDPVAKFDASKVVGQQPQDSKADGARPSQARDEASSDGVVPKVGNDRNGPGRLLRSFMEPTRGSGSFYRI